MNELKQGLAKIDKKTFQISFLNYITVFFLLVKLEVC